jgi:preprotein translocase subunit SecA
MEDELLRLFGGERMQTIVGRLGVEDDTPIEAGMLSKSIENAQKKVEARNFGIRKYVLQYDNVMNKQREIIYGERKKVLEGQDMRDNIMSMIEDLTGEAVDGAVMGSKYAEEWDFGYLNDGLARISREYSGLGLSEAELMELDQDDLREIALEKMIGIYEKKEEEIGPERMRELERMILLMVIDGKWMDHIDAMDQLKTGIGLRGIGQQDPAAAYAREGFDMFELMTESIKEDVVKYCYGVTIETKSERKQQTSGSMKETKTEEDAYKSAAQEKRRQEIAKVQAGNMPADTPKESRGGRKEPVKRSGTKVGRNDPCPCGSGKKYKNCCGRTAD